MIQVEPILTLLFGVLLTGWVHFTSSQPPLYPQDPYIDFVKRLEQAINDSTPDILPFSLKAHVIQHLMSTSNEFKELCLYYDDGRFASVAYPPIMALIETINHIFLDYITQSVKTKIGVLKAIKSVDPIGFNVYLTMNNVENSSPKFMRYAAKFQAIMDQRLHLFEMKTNDSYFEHFDEANSGTPYSFFPPKISISTTARNEIATEYGPIAKDSLDAFTDLVTDKMFTKMYRIRTDNADDYEMHTSSEIDDVQVVYGTFSQQVDYEGTFCSIMHAICVYYKASDKKVHVYDSCVHTYRSPIDDTLDHRQLVIIQKLYPFNQGIVFEMPKALQNQQTTCGIFAIAYASMLLQGKDPAQIPIKLNKVFGDETVYMRIHILNMLANQRLASFK